jgi:hypothetical protein
MLKTNLRGQIRQTILPKWKSLLPLFEAVMNAFQAAQDHPGATNHRIVIGIERDADLGLDEQAPISSFTITDTGIGFNDENFDSFNTAFSDYKLKQGGKGLGRFIWLKAFEKVEIDSVFSEPDEPHLLQRKFFFDENYEGDIPPPSVADRSRKGTIVRLLGFRDPYKSECPKASEQIAQRLAEHFLLLFLNPNCPQVEIHDRGLRLSVNKVFETDFKAASSAHKFSIKHAEFVVHGFRLTTPRVSKHRLTYAANNRAVISDNLEDYIPNLSGRLADGDGTSFVYLAIVQSSYLDQRVNNERTDFELGHPEDAEADQPSLFVDEIRRSDIRDACINYVQSDLSAIIQNINSVKEERILQFVQDDGPEYKILMKYRSEFIDRIPPAATKIEIESALHKELYQREVKIKQEGTRIIKEAEKIEDYDAYEKRFNEFMDKYNELGVSALAQYVAHRRIILDFLDRAISKSPDSGKYPLEKAVHHIIFPMQETSDDIPYYQQNLWLLDERLTYYSFVSSDKPLASLEPLENDSSKRPDLFIFDRKIAFTEGEQPITSIMVVEFKRPQRDDYKGDDNPLTQSFEMITEIRSGKFKDHRGRPISVAGDKIPASCYVICDLTPSLQKVLLNLDAEITPDKQGYYGYHKRLGVFYEVIDYNKLLRDAQKRNRIFFEKLNILGNR